MGYTKNRATIKWWDPHTKKLKYFWSVKFYEYNNTFGKGWLLGSELMTSTKNGTLPKLKMDLSDHTIIKDYIFEVAVYLPQRVNPIGIIEQYFEHNNM